MRKVTLALRHTLVLALAAALAVGPAAPRAFAGPTQIAGGNGRGRVLPQGADANRWTVQVENGAIIHYSSFDLAMGQAVEFAGISAGGGPGSGDIRVLNRIFSAAPTRIDGDITQSGGNIHVYMVNPAGVYFGPNANVNVTAMQAAAGRMSDRDFNDENDHFTGLRGRVENEGRIAAKAVSLVGGQVSNSGQVITEGGWIVMAAGRDVLIGRDGSGNGVLLRVEGAANAVFNQNARGVENTGTLTATVDSADANVGGHVSVGAGDMYGTAIFSDGAIEARKLALSADNRGDIALGGTVTSTEFSAKFGGNDTGTLRKADATPTAQTITANTVNLAATGDRGSVKVGSGLEFRGQTDPTHGPTTVTVEQKTSLLTSNLAGLDLGEDRAGTALTLRSTNGSIGIEDRELVNGTQLELAARGVIDIRGTEALDVDSLKLNALTTLSDADLIARGTRSSGNIEATTNIGFLTKAGGTLISAHEGDVIVTADITTTDGGVLRIEAKNVELGSFEEGRGARGGVIDVSGSQPNGVQIGFTDAAGVQQTESVTLNAINTSGLTLDEDDAPVPGGDVVVNAKRDITVHGLINTRGESSGNQREPNLSGGSVRIATSGADAVLTVGGISTGGGDAPAPGAAERGNIELHANRIVATGNFDAVGGTVENPDGVRNRSILIDGFFDVGTRRLTLSGGDVTVTGAVKEGATSATDPTPLDAAMVVDSSGTTTFGSTVSLDAFEVDSSGGDVIFGGNIRAEKSFDVFFSTPNTGHILTSSSEPITVFTRSATLIAKGPAPSSGVLPTTAAVVLDPGIRFNLLDMDGDPDPAVDDIVRGSFTLEQDAAIDGRTTQLLFTPGRFRVTSPVPYDPANPDNPPASQTRNGLSLETVSLRSNSEVSLSAPARSAVAGSDLVVFGSNFGVTGAPSLLDLASLEVTTFGDLTLGADFDVRATDGVTVRAGASGTGNLSVGAHIRADSISLEAGDGEDNADTGTVTIGSAARLRSEVDGNAVKVAIVQDAAIDTALLPDASVFGDGPLPLLGLDYQLESRDGAITVGQGAQNQAKIAGSNLTLTGRGGVTLGADTLVLASLTARTPEALDVATNVLTTSGGKIVLHAGTDGSGNLSVASTLIADDIELLAGSGNGNHSSSRVDLQTGAHFTGSTSDPNAPAPSRFVLEQDALIGGSSGTPVPDAALFEGGSLAGMELALRSKGASVTISDPAALAGTKLELAADTNLTVSGDLDVVSLETSSGDKTTFSGTVTADDDITLHDGATLAASDPNAVVSHKIDAGGDLIAEGVIEKTSAGDLELEATGKLSIAGAATAGRGGALTVTGTESVTSTGTLDASSGRSDSAGGALTVTSGGNVDLGVVDSRGFIGQAQTSTSTPEQTRGTNGGAVQITGANVSVGLVSAVGGNGGIPLNTDSQQGSTRGGDAGSVAITAQAPDGTIELRGGVFANGGTGASTEESPPDARTLRGQFGDVTLDGDVRLLASTQTDDGANDGDTNEIQGRAVTILGDVAPGTVADPNSTAEPPAELPLGVGFTGFTVIADGALRIDGDITAGTIDLETHTGNLKLRDSGVTQLNGNEIRLAATDGQGRHTNVLADAVVDLDSFAFVGANGTGPVTKFTLEQDASIGDSVPGGSPIPDVARFAGTGERLVPFSLGLVSQDGDVVLDASDVANVRGTKLLLAANSREGATETPIRVTGADLEVHTLSLGTATGVGGIVGGDTFVERSLVVGNDSTVGEVVLNAFGDLRVGADTDPRARDAEISGSAIFSFSGDETQELRATGVLALRGAQNVKTSGDDLEIAAGEIRMIGETSQTIANDHGALVIDSGIGGLEKVLGGLTLRGMTEDDSRAAVTVRGTLPDGSGVALRTHDGGLLVTANTEAPSGGTQGVGTYDIDGDVLVAGGNATLNGRAILDANRAGYRFEAVRNTETGVGGELTMGGISSADGDVTLRAQGQRVTIDALRPAAIHLKGDFDVDHALIVDGAIDVAEDTTIEAGGNVVLGSLAEDGSLATGSRIQGANSLDVSSRGTVLVGDDVAMTAGTLGLAGDSGVRFVSTSDSQSIQAGTIVLGNGAASPARDRGSLLRDGSLVLAASEGNVNMGRGQRLIVNGDLDVDAAAGVVLADTAALSLRVTSGDLGVYGGSTVVANSIFVSSAPRVVGGGGGATFAVPTRTEISSNVPSDDILVRGISANGAPLVFATVAGQPFDPAFPSVTGAGLFDYSRQIPRFNPRESLTRPYADPIDLDAAVNARPLWAEELLAYLEMRSIETTDDAKPADAERLPPVGARPGEPIEASDARVRGAAVENAVALYRNLFRPELRRDTETGFIDGPSNAAEIKAAFQAPIDVLRRENSGKAVAGADVAALLESDSSFGAARRYREQLGVLLDVSQRALTPDQRPRFRALVLAEVTPYGIGPADFSLLF